MKYQPRLDGLRGVAVLFVLFQHFPAVESVQWFSSLQHLFKKLGLGYIGVEVFFILSGYLITRLLVEAFENSESRALYNFYVKRAFRILPVFFLTIGVCVLVLPDYNYSYIAGFLGNYFFAFNPEPHPLRHFWSLAVEEQFYLVWPVLVLCVARSRQRVGLFLVALACVAIAVTLYRDIWVATEYSRALIHRSVETRMLALCVGGLIAVHGLPNVKLRTLFLVSILVVLSVLFFQYLASSGVWPYMKSVKTIGFLFLSLIIFLFACNSTYWFGRVFELRLLVDIGKVSYGLYVYHLPIFYYLGFSHMQKRIENISLEQAVMLVALTTLVALLSWRYFESPLMQRRHLFLHKGTRGTTGVKDNEPKKSDSYNQSLR